MQVLPKDVGCDVAEDIFFLALAGMKSFIAAFVALHSVTDRTLQRGPRGRLASKTPTGCMVHTQRGPKLLDVGDDRLIEPQSWCFELEVIHGHAMLTKH